LNTLAAITGSKAGFRSLGDAWADTTTAHGRLMLTVLGGLAEFERDLIRTRTGEGRARAVARGQKIGRPPKLTPHQRREAIKRRDRGGESLADICRSYKVSGATISRLSPQPPNHRPGRRAGGAERDLWAAGAERGQRYLHTTMPHVWSARLIVAGSDGANRRMECVSFCWRA
jgi:hypothetical protein